MSDQNDTQPQVRCACFIPGGDQCILPMHHEGKHVYDENVPFSTHVKTMPSEQQIRESFWAHKAAGK